jgi:hypothetical protein
MSLLGVALGLVVILLIGFAFVDYQRRERRQSSRRDGSGDESSWGYAGDGGSDCDSGSADCGDGGGGGE